MPNPIYTYISDIYMFWFSWVLWHIDHCTLFNGKSSLYIYIIYIIFIHIYYIYNRGVEFSGEEVIVLPLATIASLFV